MKIADLDNEARAVIVVAHVVHRFPTPENLAKLGEVLGIYDAKYSTERSANLLNGLESIGVDLPQIGEYRKHQRGG